MKKITLLLLFYAATSAADDYVDGYVRRDGTYVAPHYRSEANGYRYDNYSSQGNTNPYTGERGYQRNEYSNPPAYNQGYNGYNQNQYSSPYNQ